MGNSYYPQSDYGTATMTVGQLVERLQKQDPNAPVVFKSPFTGVFGPDSGYSIESVESVHMDRREEHYAASKTTDDETGEEYEQEAWTQVFHAWTGVFIR